MVIISITFDDSSIGTDIKQLIKTLIDIRNVIGNMKAVNGSVSIRTLINGVSVIICPEDTIKDVYGRYSDRGYRNYKKHSR